MQDDDQISDHVEEKNDAYPGYNYPKVSDSPEKSDQIIEQSGYRSESAQGTKIAFMPKSMVRASSASAAASELSVSQNQFYTKVDGIIDEN